MDLRENKKAKDLKEEEESHVYTYNMRHEKKFYNSFINLGLFLPALLWRQ